MRIYGLDINFNRIKEFEYIQVLWDRKFYEPGDFTIYMKLDQFDADVEYIEAEGRRELGIVYKTDYKTSIKGKFITLTGKFLEHYPNYTTTDMGMNILSTDNMNTKLLSYMSPLGITESNISINLERKEESIERHLKLGDEVCRILKGQEAGYQIDALGSGYNITFVKGRNTQLEFSIEQGNCQESNFFIDESNFYYKCIGYIPIPNDVVSAGYPGVVMVAGQYFEKAIVEYPVPPRISLMEKKAISKEFQLPEGLEVNVANKTKIRANLISQSNLELLNHMVEKIIDVKPIQKEGCSYLKDYDLGDYINININDIQISFTSQIVEINETWEKDTQKYELILGNKKIRR